MAFGLQRNSFTKLLLCIFLIDLSYSAENGPRLEILPTQSVQRKPIGRPLILTCQPNVEQKDLISDLRWRDSNNVTIQPKPSGAQPIIYTESLNSQQLMLVISSLTDTMAGDYFCSASYANSEMLEAKVKVETYVAITWKDAPESQSPIVGNDYLVRCVVTANPPPTVDWLRNGDQIKSSDRYVIRHDGLMIKNVQESDDGIYTCRAAVIQTGELSERNIRLDVQIPPEITSLGTEYEAIEGEEFSVKCTGRGKPAPEFKWINQDKKDMSLTDRFSVVAHNGQMSVTRVHENDRGVYTCVAKNSAGYTEQRMNLNVVVKPKIYEMKNITIAVNSEVHNFTCKAKGRPAPLITFRRWRSDEEFRVGQQENDDRIILEQNIDEELGESSGTLLISRTLRSDDGLYQCVARNKGDLALEVGHITIEYPPNFDHMKDLPPVYSWEERPANLSCMAMALPNATIEWRWNERLVREMNDKFLQIVEEGPRSDLIVKPVDRRYYSAYKCIAVNRLGRAEHIMQLLEARLPAPVAQAKPIVVTATTITFEIIGPATELGMPIKAYTGQYKEERDLDWSNAINRTWTPDTPYVVEGLKPQTMYTFRFAARNDVGLGQWSAIRVQATPSRSVPEPPKILNQILNPEELENGELPIIASTYSDRFELIWNRPADNGEPIDFFTIRYCPGGKVNNVWNEIENLCKERDYIAYTYSNQVLNDLNSDTYYRVELRAHNAIGYSAPTNVYVKTARGLDVIGVADKRINISSIAIVGIAVAGILLILILVDFLCCITVNLGIFAMLCRKPKRSPSDLDEEKFGSGSLIKESQYMRPPSPLPLPNPLILKLDDTTPADEQERQPLSSNVSNGHKKGSIVESDGKVSLGEIIGKNSAV